jgi:hypothetical protein
MNEFIESFGKTNFIIIISAIVIILFTLFLIVILEKLQGNKKNSIDFLDELRKDGYPDDEVFYVEDDTTEEEAKLKINDAAKKLVGKPEVIDHTSFEDEQEEESIISYDELVKNSDKIDESNAKVLEEENTIPITLDELLSKKSVVEEKLSDLKEEKELMEFKKEIPKLPEIPEFENSDKFENSKVISPVFGIYKESYANIDKKYEKEAEDLKALETEIGKTEDFLKPSIHIQSLFEM